MSGGGERGMFLHLPFMNKTFLHLTFAVCHGSKSTQTSDVCLVSWSIQTLSAQNYLTLSVEHHITFRQKAVCYHI